VLVKNEIQTDLLFKGQILEYINYYLLASSRALWERTEFSIELDLSNTEKIHFIVSDFFFFFYL
jgi:hypothetical protein